MLLCYLVVLLLGTAAAAATAAALLYLLKCGTGFSINTQQDVDADMTEEKD